MPENINNRADTQDVSTEIDSDQREAISRKEEEKKRLDELREQEDLISKDSLNRDESEISEDEQLEPKLVIGDDKVIVENLGGKKGDFSFSNDADRDIALLDDGTIAVSQKGNPENRYLISTNEENVVEYDFSDFDIGEMNLDKKSIVNTTTMNDEFDYEVNFNIDKEGNINIESVTGDAAGKINFKDGDKTYTLDKDGQLVEVAEESKELENEETKDDGLEQKNAEEKNKLDAMLDEIDLSEMNGVTVSGNESEQTKGESEHLDAAISELNLSEVKAVERSSAPASAETGETSRAR